MVDQLPWFPLLVMTANPSLKMEFSILMNIINVLTNIYKIIFVTY